MTCGTPLRIRATRRHRFARARPAVLAAAVTVVAGCEAVVPVGTGLLSAPLPRPALVAQGVSSANEAHLVKNQAWDFRQMRKAFNTVSLLPGDPATVAAARRAGLAVVLEFDYKADFFAGRDISSRVAAVVQQIRSAPGTVVAVHIADRINEKYSARQAIRYLAATGGVIHRTAPGVPVLVNVSDWELTCGYAGQSSCASHGDRYRYETNATVDAIYRAGYVDGFTLADNLKNEDARVQTAAWRVATSRWPAPFILWSTCSQVSFPSSRYTGRPTPERLTAAYMSAPIAGGAQGVALWAWHQLYQGEVYSFLDKDGSSNALWAHMVETSEKLGLRQDNSGESRIPWPTGPHVPAMSSWS